MAAVVGKKAPEFTLAGSNGKDVSLKDFKGKTVVVYFYPKDDTPGCTREACDFRDASRKFTTAKAVVLGVSPDSLKSHDKFIGKFDLPFTLLSDPDHAVAEKYGVWVEKSMYGRKYMGIERSTFVIGPDGKLKAAYRKVKVDGHADEVLAAVKA
jgi:peroxiredoxin Q/BCP